LIDKFPNESKERRVILLDFFAYWIKAKNSEFRLGGVVRYLAAIFAVFVTTSAYAQNLKTCSGNYQYCVAGVSSRGVSPSASQCPAAYEECLRTGVWRTTGFNGRTVTGVAKR
jgi:hypothetical protein